MLRNLSTSKTTPCWPTRALAIQDRRVETFLELDRERRQQDCGCRESQEREAHDDVDRPLDHALQQRGTETLAEDDPAWIEHVEPHLAGLALEKGRQLE